MDRLGRTQRQRARPEGIHELPGARVKGGDILGSGFFIPNMHNQRVELGPVLGGKDFGHCLFVQRIRTQAVDGFRGEGHDISGSEPFGRTKNGPWIVAVKNAGHHIRDWVSDRYSCPRRIHIL